MISEEEFLAQAKKRYQAIAKLSNIKSNYDYEKTFDQIWTDYGREVLERSISEPSKDRRKKKLITLRKDRD